MAVRNSCAVRFAQVLFTLLPAVLPIAATAGPDFSIGTFRNMVVPDDAPPSTYTLTAWDATPVGQPSVHTHDILLQNIGDATLNISSIGLTGPNADDFILTGPMTSTITPGSSYYTQLQFRPQASGLRTAAMVITSNATSPHDVYTINLSGIGVDTPVPSPDLAILPVSYKLKTNKKTGQTDALVKLTIANQGTEDALSPTLNFYYAPDWTPVDSATAAPIIPTVILKPLKAAVPGKLVKLKKLKVKVPAVNSTSGILYFVSLDGSLKDVDFWDNGGMFLLHL
jgi:hypothetical protein